MKLNRFDSYNFCMQIQLPLNNINCSLCLCDELEVIDLLPNLPVEYEQRIIGFLESSINWYPIVINVIKKNFQNNIEVQLNSIYILSEPKAEKLVFGLGFWCSEQIEHGVGIKIQETDFEVLEYGTSEIISYP